MGLLRNTWLSVLAEAKKDLAKRIYLLLAFLVIGIIILVVLGHFPSSFDEISSIFWSRIEFIKGPLLGWFIEYWPILLTICLFAFGSFCSAYYIIKRGISVFLREVARLEETLLEGGKAKNLAEHIGLIGRWPNAFDDEKGPWNVIRAYIERNDNVELCILCANGSYTFGHRGTPLYDCLKKFKGKVRIILASPESRATEQRAEALRVPFDEYKKAINDADTYISKLRDAGSDINRKFYENTYNWKLILTTHAVFIQYYTTGGDDISKANVHIFESNSSFDTFHNMFSKEFDRIWDRCCESVRRRRESKKNASSEKGT